MARLGREGGRALAQQLAGWLEMMLSDERNDVEFSIRNGMHAVIADDLASTRPAPNRSATLVVHINGGARHTAGFEDDPAVEF